MKYVEHPPLPTPTRPHLHLPKKDNCMIMILYCKEKGTRTILHVIIFKTFFFFLITQEGIIPNTC